MSLAVVVASGAAAILAALRWLRVAQREHYLPGSVLRFARRWWTLGAGARAGAIAAVLATLICLFEPSAGLLVALIVAAGPPGLGVKGRTSPLAWTSRLRRVTGLVTLVGAAGLVMGATVHPAAAAATALLMPLVVDAALAALAPYERRLGRPWVDKAATALADSGATVVAITGSYGKTTTKGYVAHLLAGERRVLASPASFNNRMGLARAVNENLGGDIDIFVAEMGTYGKGEIADLCTWIRPDVAVITAIGPVHLERFGSEDRIVEAKAEILAGASRIVLNVDDPRLERLAVTYEGAKPVVRVGTRPGRDVVVIGGRVFVKGREIGRSPAFAHPGNVACAVGVGLSLGIDPARLGERLGGLTEPEHRRTVARAASGVVVIDDTYNSNPAGARTALRALANLPVGGRRVVVTPGMVELGDRQHDENWRFATDTGSVADHLIVVGRVNRPALVGGAAATGVTTEVVATREEAVAWVRANLGEGDAVLYENDLPDHYP